jgi:hypothetical protein
MVPDPKVSHHKTTAAEALNRINSNFLDRFSKITQISNFVKIHPVRAELFHADRNIDWHDEADSYFSQFCERA